MSTISANTVSLLRFINAFRDPVFLLTSSGRVVCSNAAAREVFEEPPQWLEAAVRSEGSTAFENCGTLCPLVLDGRELFMVLPAVRDHKTSEILARLDELPPSLATVANLLLMGMSDKEVVRCTGLSLSSIRTYASRIYQRLGVSGRSELLALALNQAIKHES